MGSRQRNTVKRIKAFHPSDRKKIGIFISEELYLWLKADCEKDGLHPSLVLEDWIRQEKEEDDAEKKKK